MASSDLLEFMNVQEIVMKYAHPEALVSTAWVADHLLDPAVRIVDASHFLPVAGRNGHDEYLSAHIPGAVYFDIDDIADANTKLAHMLPAPPKFADKVGALGIRNDNMIVVYDRVTGGAAARVWWMFRVFGHQKIAQLDGGLPKWLNEGRPVDNLTPSISKASFTAHFEPQLVRGLGQMVDNLQSRHELVLDGRVAGRFTGADAEPRAGQRSGHIPGSKNVPWTDLLNPKTKTFLPAEALAARFAAAGVDPKRPISTTCGSGVTACTVAFGLYLIGREDVAVFDGSWSEWSVAEGVPVETGAA